MVVNLYTKLNNLYLSEFLIYYNIISPSTEENLHKTLKTHNVKCRQVRFASYALCCTGRYNKFLARFVSLQDKFL